MGLLLAAACSALAQSVTTRVTGNVNDLVTGKGLEGVHISLISQPDVKTTVSGTGGRFELTDVVPGRYLCQTSFVAYEPVEFEVLVIAGKESYFDISLKEETVELETVEITARPYREDPGTISLPIEKVLRFPANFFDPVRMLSSYPGVVATNDQANNVIVKGNSPSGLLWRLNGMDIVNPNHLANAGTFSDKPTSNGGGVNILSAQMLDRTDFYSGNIPARYGNFASGVLDMALRQGNTEKKELTAQASLLGLDVAAEGPLNTNHSGSILANYRYSTVGLLSQLGVNFGDEAINFQDFSFHLSQRVGSSGSLSVFGLGGISKNDFKAKDSADWEVEKDRFTIFYKSTVYAVGARYDHRLKGDAAFSSGVTLSQNDQSRDAESVITNRFPFQRSSYSSSRMLVSSFANVNMKFNDAFSGEAGLMANFHDDDLAVSELVPGQTSPGLVVDAAATSALVQPYLQLVWQPGRFSAGAGGRYLYTTANGKSSFDYRSSIEYKLAAHSTLALSVGQVSQQPMATVTLVGGNDELDFMRKFFVEADHTLQLKDWRINSSAYHQEYTNVPVLPSSSFSMLNFMDGVAPSGLTSSGTGRNSGVSLQAERMFRSNFYMLMGGSVYDSRYTGGDGIERKTRFNGRYTLQLTLGREKLKQEQDRTKAFGVHARFLFLGGLRDTPVNESLSRTQGRTVYAEQDAFINALKDYMRADLRVSWRKDKKGYTRTVSVDVQNLVGLKNEAFKYFDTYLDRVETQYQLGLIPVLVYRVDF